MHSSFVAGLFRGAKDSLAQGNNNCVKDVSTREFQSFKRIWKTLEDARDSLGSRCKVSKGKTRNLVVISEQSLKLLLLRRKRFKFRLLS